MSMLPRAAGCLVLALLLAAPCLASAAGLSDADYRYLKAQFGLARDGFTLTNIAAADAEKLHALINDREDKEFPRRRELNVADYLFDTEMRTCQAWQLAHASSSCPQVTDPAAKPGWQIAERNCIACHLTGTTDAPSFFKLAQSGPVSEQRLAAALHSGHQMSPISLGSQELEELARYINSLR
jgi:hypothetical protein